jgi:hypothetical protein
MKKLIIYRPELTALLIAALLSLFSCSKKDSQGPTPETGPVITSFSADTVWIGKIITINGSGFSATATENTVRIGNTTITEISAATATTITIKVPAGATSGKVFVKVNGVEKAGAKDLVIVNQLAWQKALGGTTTDYALSVAPSSDGGYLVAGYTSSTDGDVTGIRGGYDYWVVKLNADRTIAWQKTLGGASNDVASHILPLADGGCLVTGYTYSTDGDVTGNHGSSDYWIVKLNAGGAIVWQRVLGGTGSDVPTSAISTSNGYVVAGYTTSNDGNVTGNHGGNDFWIVWLDVNGALTSQKTFGGTGTDYAYSLTATTDGGYLVAGQTASTNGDVTGNHGSNDYWVLKLNISGNLEWQKTFGGTGSDIARSIISASDGTSIVAGYTKSTNGDVTGNHGNNDYWIVKLNTTGTIVWQKALGGSGSDQAILLAPASNGGCAVAGYSESTDGDVTGNHGMNDAWVVRLDASGAIVWQKALGGTLSDASFSITATSNNSFIAAGISNSTDGDVSGVHGNDADYWLFKILD